MNYPIIAHTESKFPEVHVELYHKETMELLVPLQQTDGSVVMIYTNNPNEEFIVRMNLPSKLQHADVQFVVQSSEGGTFESGGCDNSRASGFGTGEKDDIVYQVSSSGDGAAVSIWGGWATEHEAVTLTPKLVLKLLQKETEQGDAAASYELSKEEEEEKLSLSNGNNNLEGDATTTTRTTVTEDTTYNADDQTRLAEDAVLEDERMIQKELEEVAEMQAKMQHDYLVDKDKNTNKLQNNAAVDVQQKMRDVQDRLAALSEQQLLKQPRPKKNPLHVQQDQQKKLADVHARIRNGPDVASMSDNFRKMKEAAKSAGNIPKVKSLLEQEKATANTRLDDPESSFSLEMFPFACFFALFVVIISLSIAQGSQSNRQHVE